MSKQLIPLTIGTPGFFGLNTQDAGSVLPPGWATTADNCSFDDLGRLAARMGTRQVNGTILTGTPAPTVLAIGEHWDLSGNATNILAADNKIYKESGGIMTDVSGTITTPTGDDWQFALFNGNFVGYQSGHTPIENTSAAAPAFADATGTQKNGSMVLSAYGRLWTVVSGTLWYSDLLINDYGSGSAGSLNLSQYWPNGYDEAIALADFNGFLVVFGKESIIIYENPDDVDNIAIAETVSGIGCPYRDTVQVIGSDLVFLSETGLRSLKETLQRQGKERMDDISRHVRDQLLLDLSGETPIKVKSAYHPDKGFYALSLPTKGRSYYFDTRFKNNDGSWRVCTWNIAPTAFHYSRDETLYLAVTDGYLSKYTGYRDEDSSGGTGGESYSMIFEGVWNDFGQEVGNLIKIPKNVSVVGAGVAGGVVNFRWRMDYSTAWNSVSLSFNANAPSTYNNANYAVDTYSASADFERVRSQLTRTGQVLMPGVTTTIDGNAFALQRIDLLAKVGKLGL